MRASLSPKAPTVGGLRHGGFVDTALGADLVDPTAQWVVLLFRATDDGAGAMYEQAAQLAVSAFADAQQGVFSAATVLPGYQPNRCRYVTATATILAIVHVAVEGAGDDGAKAGNGLQSLAGIILLAMALQLPGVEIDVFIQCLELLVAPR